MRSIFVSLLLCGCLLHDPVPCDSVIHDEEDSYGQDCAEIDITSTVPFDSVQFVMGQSGIDFVHAAVTTPAMLASGEAPPTNFAELRRVLTDPTALGTEHTELVKTLDGNGDGWDDRAVVMASNLGVLVATGVVHLLKVDRSYESYLVGSVELVPDGVTLEHWGLTLQDRVPLDPPCVRAVEPDRTTYYVIDIDADCDGIDSLSDVEPTTYNARVAP